MALTTLQPADRGYKLEQVLTFLQQYPHHNGRRIGHRDQLSNPAENQSLALQRAIAVREALVKQGADFSHLAVLGAESFPGKGATPLAWQRRYVEFESIAPGAMRSEE